MRWWWRRQYNWTEGEKDDASSDGLDDRFDDNDYFFVLLPLLFIIDFCSLVRHVLLLEIFALLSHHSSQKFSGVFFSSKLNDRISCSLCDCVIFKSVFSRNCQVERGDDARNSLTDDDVSNVVMKRKIVFSKEIKSVTRIRVQNPNVVREQNENTFPSLKRKRRYRLSFCYSRIELLYLIPTLLFCWTFWWNSAKNFARTFTRREKNEEAKGSQKLPFSVLFFVLFSVLFFTVFSTVF